MKNIIIGAALLCWLTVPAVAADYAVINLNIPVNKPAEAVWAKVGDYCAISAWMKIKCVITSGSGDVGTIRHLNDTTDEILVGKTPLSYTYTHTLPASIVLYGTLEVRAIDARRSQIYYTLIYDQAPLTTPEARDAARKMRTTRFQTAIKTMKVMAEAN